MIKHEYQNILQKSIIGLGDSKELLKKIPDNSIDLVWTSPPYMNAKPEYSIYNSYQEYLEEMKYIFSLCINKLKEGRFIVINSSPVIVARLNRQSESVRLPIPFDLNSIITNLKCKFMEDIIWIKPEASSCGRNRSFDQHRTPLAYKTNPVTEYIMVYRKQSDNLIDWHIRNHPDQKLVEDSQIEEYEKTNIWKINPETNSQHPAAFPLKLATNVIKYYSFVNDFVLDPFAGSGTVGLAAIKLKRNFVLLEKMPEYYEMIKNRILIYVDSENVEEIKQE